MEEENLSLFQAKIILEKPDELPKTVWTGEVVLPDEATRDRFVVKTLGAVANRYAADHNMKIHPPLPDARTRDLIELFAAGEGDKEVWAANLRLSMALMPDKDGWVSRPTADGLWWYIGRNDEGEEVMSMAFIELAHDKPVRGVIGSSDTFDFDHKSFVGSWKKAAVPRPAGWWVENEHDPKAGTPCLLPQPQEAQVA